MGWFKQSKEDEMFLVSLVTPDDYSLFKKEESCCLQKLGIFLSIKIVKEVGMHQGLVGARVASEMSVGSVHDSEM